MSSSMSKYGKRAAIRGEAISLLAPVFPRVSLPAVILVATARKRSLMVVVGIHAVISGNCVANSAKLFDTALGGNHLDTE